MSYLGERGLSTTAMVLAAGLGTRLRPLSLTKPKPLFEVGGRTMLDLAIDKLRAVGVEKIVVNVFYLPEQIIAHLAQRTDVDIIISQETELLDTGGGIKNALHHFGDLPFFVLNADLPWVDHERPALVKMRDHWQSSRMDVQLLLMQTRRARGFKRDGDFMLEEDGYVWRRNAPMPRSHVLISAQIMKPQLIAAETAKIFSNNIIWDKVEAEQRLYGVEHEGECFHVGTPEDWEEANRRLASGEGWGVS